MSQARSNIECRIHDAIVRLRALREGEVAIDDLKTCGQAAIEPLRKFLFERDPSGIFQPRCQAVEALASLGAKDVLIDFLANLRDVADPVEQAGEDAVANAVARALIRWPDDYVFLLLMDIAKRKLLAGVVEAIGEYRREAAMPILVTALGDDFCRSAAENAFRKMGPAICPRLLQLADYRTPSPDFETDSSQRRRYSSLMLFIELYEGEDLLKFIRTFMGDSNPRIALLACSSCLPKVSAAEKEEVTMRLVELLDSSDWTLRAEVEDLLIQHYANCRSIVEKKLTLVREPAAASLRRVVIKGCASSGLPLPRCLSDELKKGR